MITSFSAMNKGTFAMNRGTPMFLKRLFLTALGALGLGALASGPAYSQQLPAPDLFAEITRCNPTLPHGGMGNASGLGALLDVDRTVAAATIDSTERGNVLQTVTGAGCNNPVGNGYATAVTLYDEYVRTKAALPSGRAADEFTQREFDTASANKDAYGGAVYNEVYNQLMKRKEADDAIGEYNKLVGATGEFAVFKARYDDLNFDLWGLRDRDDNDLVGQQLETERTRAYGQGARGFIPLNGNNTPGDTEIDGTEFEDAFDASGRLRFHPTTDSDVASTGVSLILDKFGELEAELKKWTDFAAAKQKELDDAIKEGNLNLVPLRENVRRAGNARDYVKGELNRLLRVGKAYNYPLIGGRQFTVGTGTDAETIMDERTLLNRYERAGLDLDSAASNVRSAVGALDSANTALNTALKGADSYLSQLIGLRQYEKGVADKAVADNGGADAPAHLKTAATNAAKAVTAARDLRAAHTQLTGSPDSPAGKLLDALLKPNNDAADDDGLAVINAITETHKAALDAEQTAMDAKAKADEVADMLGDGGGVGENTMKIGENADDIMDNADDIMALDGRVATNEEDLDHVWMELIGTERGVEAQHDEEMGCAEGAMGISNVANCANARSMHNEATLEDHAMKLMQKKEYIDNLAAEIGVDPVTGEGTMDGYSRIDHNHMRSMDNANAIMDNADAIDMNKDMIGSNTDMIATNAENIKTNADNIMQEQMDRMAADEMLMAADVMLKSDIDANKMMGMANMDAIDMNKDMIGSNTMKIGENSAAITRNSGMISDNSRMIGELSESLEVVRAGVAASMALAGMPAVNGRGIAIGVGSYDGESAFAVGFQVAGEQASFQVGITSSGGETGASAGVGFQF